MNTFILTALAAEKPFYEGECETIQIPTHYGQYGIQANHSDMILAITPGTLKVKIPQKDEYVAAVSSGLAKIENNKVLILVDTIELPEEIDINRALRSKEEAKEALLQKKSIQDYYAAQAKMARAINRLKIKKSYGK